MPVRKVVTRSGKRFRGKFPSRKLGRMVQWESLHERDAMQVLEYWPLVTQYEEQPSEETYYTLDGAPRRYYPDLRACMSDGKTIDIEVKPSAKLLDPKLAHKYSLIAKRYEQLGRLFEIWTEKDIRKEPRFSTIREIHRARQRFPSLELEDKVWALRDRPELRLKDAAQILGGRSNVLHLIAKDTLRINIERTLDDDALVWLSSFKGGRDGSV